MGGTKMDYENKFDDVLKMLKRSAPFIYQTENLGTVYIDSTKFDECTDDEKELYEKFKNEMDRLHELKYPLDKRDTVTLVGLLNEILKIRDTSRKCENVLLNSLTNLTSEELDELKKQHDDYIEALDYRDGAHYRHS